MSDWGASSSAAEPRSGESEPNTCFVGNLPDTAEERDLEQLFDGLSVQNIRLIRERESNRLKGFGYVAFSSEADYSKALELDGFTIGSNEIKIAPAVRRDNSNRQQQSRGGNAFGGSGFDRGYNSRSDFSRSGGDASRDNDAFSAFGGNSRYNNRGGDDRGGHDRRGGGRDRPQNPVPDEAPFKAYIGNLPQGATQGDVEKLFENIRLVSVDIRFDRITGEAKNFGYVEFADREGLVAALDYNKADWSGSVLRVDVATSRGRDGGRGGGGRGGGAFQQRGGERGGEQRGGQRREEQQHRGRRDEGAREYSSQQRQSDPTFESFGSRGNREEGGGNYQQESYMRELTEDEKKGRPKFNFASALAAPATSSPSKSSKPNPFGAAKPVDTAAVERKREEERKRRAAEQKKKTEGATAE